MFSGLIPGLNSVESLDDDRAPACFRTLFNLPDHCVTFFRREMSYSGVLSEFPALFIWSIAGVIVTLSFVSFAWSGYLKKKRTRGSYTVEPQLTEVAGKLPESDVEAVTWISLNDAPFHENKGGIVPKSDAEYAEDLQVQEALFASLLTSQIASSSVSQARPGLNSKMVKIAREVGEPSQSFCEICLENRETWQMFRNETCSHSFCYDCTSKHVAAKIQENTKIVMCPGVNCNAMLDSDDCRSIIPKDTLVQWDESLCNSLILESQKVYCPFSNCSAMLVNDSGEVIRKIKCPVCGRSLCGLCRVPWHTEFTCKEFQKLNAKKKGREDLMVDMLAKKKQWRKCPRCTIYVEKTEGCLHITCRCKYEFCYRCGSKWSPSHGSCRRIS